MTVALVTGGHGWVGRHLLSALQADGYRVWSLGRRRSGDTEGSDADYVQADLARPGDLVEQLAAVRPDVVFHLAAVPPQGSVDPVGDAADGVVATYHLCRALRSVGAPARLIIAGSSAQYGPGVGTARPITETRPCRPVSDYGYGKLASELIALGFGTPGRLEVVAARPFNHIGPGESSRTVSGALARAIAAVARGDTEVVEAYDLDVVRDFTDVRDIARGYLALAERGVPGRIYNVCSGRPAAISHILDKLLSIAGLDRTCVSIRRTRTDGLPYQLGSPTRIRHDTGWRALLSLDESLRDLLLPLLEGDSRSR